MTMPTTMPALNLVDMLRLDDAVLATYVRDLCVLQLRAGYDWFVCHGAVKETAPRPAVPELTGDLLRTLRLDLGLSQTGLGERLKVSDKLISKWENGHGEIPAEYRQILWAMMNGQAEETIA
jgi:DNA-binding XRE family transcriptional regulator